MGDGGGDELASVEGEIQGMEFANCNCIYACPCQFNALPDKGFCEAVAGYQIDQGRFGEVRLDGLRAAGMWRWPGAVHEGNGSMQLVVDERADFHQRDALVKILSGQETEDMATGGWVFGAMKVRIKCAPVFHPIKLRRRCGTSRRARLEEFRASCSLRVSRFAILLPAQSTECASISRLALSSV